MHDETAKELKVLNARLAQIIDMIAPGQAELRGSPDAIARADFFKPLNDALEEVQKLARKFGGEATVAAAPACQFRASDHGLSKAAIERLADELIDAARARAEKGSTDWTNL